MKKRIVLSGVSIVLVLCLLVGASFAWFTDTEKVGASFSAGVLDAVLTPENPNAESAIDFTNMRPLTLEQLEASFQNGDPVANVPGEGFPADNLPLYFHKVNIKNAGTLPMCVTLSFEEGAPCDQQIPNMVDNGAGGVKPDGTTACDNSLKDVLQMLLYQQDADGNLVAVNAAVWQDGQSVSYVIPGTLAANAETDYILAAWLPSDVTNAYQAKHFHGKLVVSASQPDATGSSEPTPPEEGPWDGESVEPVTPDGNTYEISNGAQLAWIAQQVNTKHDNWQDRENFMNKTIVQTADIDLGGHEFPGIGTNIDYYFGGTYDGGGYSISNFTINRPTFGEGNYVGLFSYVRGQGTVKNLTVKDATITGYSNVGGIAGYVYGGKIENCTNYATVIKTSGPSGGAGGIAGGTGASVNAITNCKNYGEIKGWGYLGGILGSSINTGSYVTLSITGCYSEGAIIPDEGKEEYAGSFAGCLEDYVKVSDCTVLRNVYPTIVAKGSTEGISTVTWL